MSDIIGNQSEVIGGGDRSNFQIRPGRKIPRIFKRRWKHLSEDLGIWKKLLYQDCAGKIVRGTNHDPSFSLGVKMCLLGKQSSSTIGNSIILGLPIKAVQLPNKQQPSCYCQQSPPGFIFHACRAMLFVVRPPRTVGQARFMYC